MTKNPTDADTYLAMDRRLFGEYVDRYVKEDNGTPPLTVAARKCMEGPAVLPRLYQHLVATKSSIEIQIRGDEVALEFELAKAEAEGASDKRLAQIRQKALGPSRSKYRFANGLNAALGHVTWLYTEMMEDDHLILERNELLSKQSRLRETLDGYRQVALDDPDGTLDREEDLWKNVAWLIGPTPEDD